MRCELMMDAYRSHIIETTGIDPDKPVTDATLIDQSRRLRVEHEMAMGKLTEQINTDIRRNLLAHSSLDAPPIHAFASTPTRTR